MASVLHQKQQHLLLICITFFLLESSYIIESGFALNNGLARTPPMGWLSWMKYACNVNCATYPNECINEKLYTDMIDRVVADGYLSAGYKYVNIDDCWMQKSGRGHDDRLVPDAQRFPHGIKWLANYAHTKGALLGIYEDVGTLTCGGYPGTYYKEKDYTSVDAETFSDWQVDMLKLDGCYEKRAYNASYPEYSKALTAQKHKIVYACSWPAYLGNINDQTYKEIRDNCNYWRNYNDIVDSWQSVATIIQHYYTNAHTYAKYHGPGAWFDPDMLVIGNNGLSLEQAKSQMAFWCMWSAPLFMSNDLRTIKAEFKQILLNKHLIELDQDPLGLMALPVSAFSNANYQIWVKKLSSPKSAPHKTPYGLLFYNNNNLGVDKIATYSLNKLIPELNATEKYAVQDLYENAKVVATLEPHQSFTVRVPTSGSVRIFKIVPV